MITQQGVLEKVKSFVKDTFPEVWSDVQETGMMEEFAASLFEMLVGDFQEED